MIEVRGAEQLAELSKRLREAADRDLQRELSGFAIPGSCSPLADDGAAFGASRPERHARPMTAMRSPTFLTAPKQSLSGVR